jgi:hypothetical protein
MTVYNYLLLLVPVVGIAVMLVALRRQGVAPRDRLHPGE